ncbi:hypothetical protein V7S43_018031 [Phytophthora oleae]|uniref:Uncharacterized protein n=1 Tax=Phytophthora oleae TaxID=2107226 RepID=A0ABD3ESF0_9STRA
MPSSNMDEISSGVKLLFSPVNSTSARTLSPSARLHVSSTPVHHRSVLFPYTMDYTFP